MKKTNIITALAIIALSATQIMALELDSNATKEITQEVKATITQELATQAQKGQEIPDYQSLNQQFINKLEKAAAESKYETKAECRDCFESEPSVGTWWTDGTHSSVKEVYDNVLENYKNFLEALSTKIRYNKKNEKEIHGLINSLYQSIKLISADERDEYINFLCKQDRYFLKAKDSIVNMSFLYKEELAESSNEEYRSDYPLVKCLREQEPVKIKVHSFWKYITSPQYLQEVGEGFQSEAAAGK